jgi:hypothetical protein
MLAESADFYGMGHMYFNVEQITEELCTRDIKFMRLE